MTERENESGLTYAVNILKDKWQPTVMFWLGLRPLSAEELQTLIPELTASQLAEVVYALQNLRVVNPVKDTKNKFSLTDDGEQLRQLMISTSVWGLQQQDDNAARVSDQVVEPEPTASMSDLLKYTKTVKRYLA